MLDQSLDDGPVNLSCAVNKQDFSVKLYYILLCPYTHEHFNAMLNIINSYSMEAHFTFCLLFMHYSKNILCQ